MFDVGKACSLEADPACLALLPISASDISGPDLDAETIDEIGRDKLSLHITW